MLWSLQRNEFNGTEKVYYKNGIIHDSVTITVPLLSGMKYSVTAKIQPTKGETVKKDWKVVSNTVDGKKLKGKAVTTLKAELPAFKKCKSVDVKIVATYIGEGDTWRVMGK